jgi:hypothetical protein
MQHPIPPTLQQSLTARLGQLGPVRQVAQIGAVIGRDFSYSLLRPVGWPVPAACTALVERPGEVVGNDDSNYYSRPMAFGAVRLVRRRRYQARR